MPSYAGGATGGRGPGSTFTQVTRGSGVTPRPVTVTGPNRNDFGDPGPRPVIGKPTRGDYGDPRKNPGYGAFLGANKAAHDSAAGFNDPIGTAAFHDLMNLESEQGAAVEGEVARSARDAASRSGYSGGFGARSRQAQQDQFQALAEGGMAASSAIRGEQLDKYKTDSTNAAGLAQSLNETTAAGDRAFAGDLAAAARGQGELDLGFGKLIQDRNLSFAEAQQEANRLQAQLDSAFQNQLIDAGRYNQISSSVQAQLDRQKAVDAEDKRRFDLTRSDQQGRDKALQAELAKQRRTQGIDPTSGQRFGANRYNPGSTFAGM